MTSQYHTVNDCLRLLGQSILPSKERLLIEVQLIHVKMLLLTGMLHLETRIENPDEDIFQHLLELMRKLSVNVYDKAAVADVPQRIDSMLADIHDCIDSIVVLLAAYRSQSTHGHHRHIAE